MADEFHAFEDLLRDEDFTVADKFTNDDVKWALSQLMDGVKQHELPDMTGLSASQCAKIFCIAQFATETRGNFVIGETVLFDGCDDVGQIEGIISDYVFIRCNGKLYYSKVDKVHPYDG